MMLALTSILAEKVAKVTILISMVDGRMK